MYVYVYRESLCEEKSNAYTGDSFVREEKA